MVLCMTHYYFLKKLIDKLPASIHNNMEYDNDLLFNCATFTDAGIFYKIFNPIKKDKYQLNNKLKSDKFDEFILECLYICKNNNNYKQLLLIYALIAHNILEEHISKFLSVRVTRKLKYPQICNMIDFYYSKANDNIDLTKQRLTEIFPNGFTYHDFIENLINKPFIKVFSTFCTKSYYKKSLRRKDFFYTYFTRSKTKLKLIPYTIYDFLFNHRGKPKARYYLYSSKVDTSIFNLTNKPYLIGDETYNYSLDDVINNALEEAKEYVDAINLYISYDNDKQLKKIFNIADKPIKEE